MLIRTVVLTAAVLATVACDQRAAFDRLVPKDDAAFAMTTFDALRQGNVAAVETLLDQSVPRDTARPQLEQVSTVLGPAAPQDAHVIGAFTNTVNGETTYVTLTLEYRFAQRWVVASMALHRVGNVRTIDALHVQPTVDSQEHLNQFTFIGKSAAHYVMLSLAILVPAFIVVTLVVLWRTPMPRRKWLWGIFVAIGIGQFTFNWTTGQAGFQLLQVALLGGGFAKPGPYGPLLLSVAVPIGAVVFLARRRQLANTPLQPPSGDAS
jgi:hypothetical protein